MKEQVVVVPAVHRVDGALSFLLIFDELVILNFDCEPSELTPEIESVADSIVCSHLFIAQLNFLFIV